MPLITAKITVVETKQVHDREYHSADQLMLDLAINMGLAEGVLGRELNFSSKFNGDFLTITVVYADNGADYMIVEAQRHFPQQGNHTVH